MAIVNVSEYPTVATNANGVVQIPLGTPLATYDISVGASAAAGATLNSATRLVRLNTDVTCRVKMAVSPVAGAADTRFSAGATEFWGVPGPGMAISVIQSS